MTHSLASHEATEWRLLADRFAELVASDSHDRAPWHEVWQLLIGAPCFQYELQERASGFVRGLRLPPDWVGDVVQDVILILARQLRASGDLHVDRQRLPDGFATWMRSIIRRTCLEALRTPRRQRQRVVRLPEEDAFLERDSIAMRDERLDLRLAVEELAEPRRTMLLLYDKKVPLAEIATCLGLSTAAVNREVKQGIVDLKEMLGD